MKSVEKDGADAGLQTRHCSRCGHNYRDGPSAARADCADVRRTAAASAEEAKGRGLLQRLRTAAAA